MEAANFHPRGLPSIRISLTHEEWKKIIPDTFQSQITQIKDTGKREGQVRNELQMTAAASRLLLIAEEVAKFHPSPLLTIRISDSLEELGKMKKKKIPDSNKRKKNTNACH